MSVAQPASLLVLSGLTSSGFPIVQTVALSDVSTVPQTVSPHGEVFPVEECQPEDPLASDELENVKEVIRTQLDEISSEEKRVEEKEVEKREDAEESLLPIASSDQFERKRTASLAAALLAAEHAPGQKAIVHFVRPSGDSALIEACESAEDTEEKTAESGTEPSTETVIASLLLTLRSLQMSDPDRHANALRRLQDLEQELRAIGAVCPPDTAVSDAVAKALANASSNSDIQIRVNTSRHSTTTKTVFETETPGMDGLDAENVQRLQQQLISNMMSHSAAPQPPQPAQSSDSFTPVTDQKHESMAEGFTSDDGSVVVSKKMTRVVTTTRSTLPGDAEPTAGDLIRLKVNEQVYSGSVDPTDQHIHLVAITQTQKPFDQPASATEPQL